MIARLTIDKMPVYCTAIHYYGRIFIPSRTEQREFDAEYILTSEQAGMLNEWDKSTDNELNHPYKAGDSCSRFMHHSHVLPAVIEQLKPMGVTKIVEGDYADADDDELPVLWEQEND